MSLPIKIVSTDFDGTIFAESERPQIAEKFVTLIGEWQARGVKWVINTGRDLPGVLVALEQAGVSARPDAMVLVEREIYFRAGDDYEGLAEWNERCTRTHRELFARIEADLPRLAVWIRERYDTTIYADGYSPFCLMARRTAEAEAIHQFLDEYCATVPGLHVVRNDVYARLAHNGYDKGAGLTEVARRWGVPPENILAAGDHLNDLPMLRRQHAHWLVTNANAIDSVKTLVRQQNGHVSPLPCAHGIVDGMETCLHRAKEEIIRQAGKMKPAYT